MKKQHKFVKPILISLAIAAPVALVVGLSVNWDNTKNISCIGSGGVKPFIEAFGNKYREQNSHFDVTVESGGSTFGIQQVAQKLCNIGDASKNPYNDAQKYLDTWTNNHFKTVTIAWEGLSIMYIMPEGLSQDAKNNFDLYVGQDNINDLYTAFSGFNENAEGKTFDLESTSYYHFLTPNAKSHMDNHDLEICKNTQIVPFNRSGGCTAANASLSFYEESHFDKNLTVRQQQAFMGGQYGPDRLIYQTDESNSKSWDLFHKSNKPGSMIYFTSSFSENPATRELIAKEYPNYRYMSYQAKGKTNITKYNFDTIANGYEWYRPINCMFSLDDKDTFDFVNWIFFQSKYDQIMTSNGAKPLNSTQIESMQIAKDKTWVNDIELANSRPEPYKKLYGAIK